MYIRTITINSGTNSNIIVEKDIISNGCSQGEICVNFHLLNQTLETLLSKITSVENSLRDVKIHFGYWPPPISFFLFEYNQFGNWMNPEIGDNLVDDYTDVHLSYGAFGNKEAAYFDEGSYIKLTSPFQVFEGSFTVSMWVKPSSLTQTKIILGNLGLTRTFVLSSTSNEIILNWDNAVISTGMLVPDGDWRLVAFVSDRNAGEVRFFCSLQKYTWNGLLDQKIEVSHQFGPFIGTMKNIRIFDYALSDEDVELLHGKDYEVLWS